MKSVNATVHVRAGSAGAMASISPLLGVTPLPLLLDDVTNADRSLAQPDPSLSLSLRTKPVSKISGTAKYGHLNTVA